MNSVCRSRRQSGAAPEIHEEKQPAPAPCCSTTNKLKSNHKRTLPKKKSGGVGSRTMKGKNRKTHVPTANDHLPDPPALNISQQLDEKQLKRQSRDRLNKNIELQEQVKELKEAMDDMEMRLSTESKNHRKEMKEASTQLSRSHAKNARLEDINATLKAKIEAMEASVVETKTKYNAKRREMNAEIGAAKQEVTQLRKTIKEMTASHQSKVIKLAGQLDDMQSERFADKRAVNMVSEYECTTVVSSNP